MSRDHDEVVVKGKGGDDVEHHHHILHPHDFLMIEHFEVIPPKPPKLLLRFYYKFYLSYTSLTRSNN